MRRKRERQRKKYKGNKERVRKIKERLVNVLSIKWTGSGLFVSLLCAE
jgi:di/tricarboxylate transporter